MSRARLRSKSVRRHRHDKKRSTFRRRLISPGQTHRIIVANAGYADYGGPGVVSEIVGAINSLFRSRLGRRGS